MRVRPGALVVAVEASEDLEAGAVLEVAVGVSVAVEDLAVDSVAALVVLLALELAQDLEPRVSSLSQQCLQTRSLTLRHLVESGPP